MIACRQVSKRFARFVAVEDLSFDVAPGEIVGLLGPNGAGKSTTMRILAGVFPPTTGEVRVAGHDVVSDPLRARAAVGYFPERVSVHVDMMVENYLTYVGRMKNLSAREARRHSAQAMEACDLTVVAKRIIGSLSKGFRQRVGIAQALVGDPKLLILDEPTAGLDPEQVAEMRSLIFDLKRDRTVLLSTHILPEVETTCDRVIIIRSGRIVAVDTPANLNLRLQGSARVRVEIRGPQAQVLQHLASLDGIAGIDVAPSANGATVAALVSVSPASDPREAIARSVTERGWGLRELRPVAFTLEEIFLSLVGDAPPPPDTRNSS